MVECAEALFPTHTTRPERATGLSHAPKKVQERASELSQGGGGGEGEVIVH